MDENRIRKFTFVVHVTIGFAFKGDIESIDKWIDKADDNLYYGKNNGKNVVIG
ncbi:MAG: hypothetical protein K6B44_04865 [Lachnospiraceae bacterium]|nr:hypothetical protein [Lachnospiraceae bacterium]